MYENMMSAQTSEASEGNVVAGNENADVTKALEGEQVNDTDFSDSNTEDRKDETKQVESQNSVNAQRRREAEQRRAQKMHDEVQKERRAARESAIIEILDGKNPYTGEEMKDSKDVEEYLMMKEIEKNGGDPLQDFSKYHKAKERERETKANEKAQQEDWYQKDREAFVAKYPDINLNDLIADEKFSSYADGKVGIRPLSEIYEGYQALFGGQAQQVRHMAAQMIANKKASPGALSTSESGKKDFFSAEEVKKMSPTDIRKNYDTIRESMKKW